MVLRRVVGLRRTLRSIMLITILVPVAWCGARAQAPAAAQLQHAARFMDAGDWQKAEQTLQVVLRAHPGNADALNLLAWPPSSRGAQRKRKHSSAKPPNRIPRSPALG